ncbi:MAG: hypothetical protein WC205_15540 [Opitutaceae bacterium]|jgi:hypothetical protein
MNIKLAFASLALVIAAPIVASAQSAVPGKVGNVTLALVHTTYTEDYKETPTDKSYKEFYNYTNVKSKYGNKEFIADLIDSSVLEGAVADWTIKYLDYNDGDTTGLFAVNKDGSVVYINSDIFDTSFLAGYAFSGTYSYVTTIKDDVDQISKENDSWKETDKVDVYMSPFEGAALILTAFHNYGYSYKEVYDELNDTLVSASYSIPASSFSSIVGHDDNDTEGGIISGSINVSALKDTADVSAFLNALP